MKSYRKILYPLSAVLLLSALLFSFGNWGEELFQGKFSSNTPDLSGLPSLTIEQGSHTSTTEKISLNDERWSDAFVPVLSFTLDYPSHTGSRYLRTLSFDASYSGLSSSLLSKAKSWRLYEYREDTADYCDLSFEAFSFSGGTLTISLNGEREVVDDGFYDGLNVCDEYAFPEDEVEGLLSLQEDPAEFILLVDELVFSSGSHLKVATDSPGNTWEWGFYSSSWYYDDGTPWIDVEVWPQSGDSDDGQLTISDGDWDYQRVTGSASTRLTVK